MEDLHAEEIVDQYDEDLKEAIRLSLEGSSSINIEPDPVDDGKLLSKKPRKQRII